MNDTLPAKAEIQKRIEDALARRHADSNRKGVAMRRDEAAFLSGAGCALQAVFGNPDDEHMTDYIPPAWILAPMCGRLLSDLKKRNGDA